jgi:uncharacterized membrane protein YkoI
MALLLDKARPNPLHYCMKLISLAVVVLLSCSSLQASPNESKGHPKITKNEAEHIALKHFPGASVASAKLESVQGQLVWTLQIAAQKKERATRVEVDAMTGRIVSPAEKKP